MLAAERDLWAWKRADGPRWWAYLSDLVTRGRTRFGVHDTLRRIGEMTGVERRHPLLDDLALQPNWRVVELGCGPGAFSRRVLRRLAQGGVLIGVDSSSDLLGQAARALASAGPAPGQALALAQTDTPARPAERSLAQKISDLGRVTLASLTPYGGLLHPKGPDLAALGYDGLTAVYDLSARAVYLPNGVVLEAHSGMGSMRDDLDHVNVHMTGATPPAEYELKPRERMFHGVAALRMTPVEGSDIYGRSGLLVHSYMLGRDGDSNGCVSIKDYDKFLKAFNDGEVNRLVVIPSLSGATVVAQRGTQPS